MNMKMHDSRSYANAKTIFDHESVITKINFTLNFDRKIQRRKKIINTDPNTESKYKTLLHNKTEQTKTHKSRNLRQTDRSDKKSAKHILEYKERNQKQQNDDIISPNCKNT